jgi:hypothetical protein
MWGSTYNPLPANRFCLPVFVGTTYNLCSDGVVGVSTVAMVVNIGLRQNKYDIASLVPSGVM